MEVILTPEAPISTPAKKTSTLTIRKSSRLMPFVMLLLTALFFVAYALPSNFGSLAKLLGFQGADPSAKAILAHAADLFAGDDPKGRTAFWNSFGFHPLRFIGEVLFPLFKAWLEVLGHDFVDITQKVVGTVGIIAAYSLVPGIAGLVYRRQFAKWFVASFLVLLAVNASGLFPKLSIGGEPMPSSGQIFFFLLAQIVVLLAAYRLRRHGQSLGWLAPRWHNWGLKALLVAAGLLIYQFWIPISPIALEEQDRALREPQSLANDQKAGKASSGLRDCDDVRCPGLAKLEISPSSPIYVGLYEITHAEWDACSNAAPDLKPCRKIDRPIIGSDRIPVEVTHEDAVIYLQWLSGQTKATYRLPSRSEWQAAARGNAPPNAKWSFGDDRKQLEEYAWYAKIGASWPHHVGLLKPNSFGLYDVHGNAAEWIDRCRQSSGIVQDGCSQKPAAIGGRLNELPADLELKEPPLGNAEKAGIRVVREAGSTPPAIAPTSQAAVGAAVGGAQEADAKAQQANAADATATTPPTRSGWSMLTSGFTGLLFKWEVILLGLPLIYTLFRNSEAWTSSKPKNIVICLDGTSNNPDQVENGFAATTNVYKLFGMLKADKSGMFAPGDVLDASLCKKYGENQIGLYYAGVGNHYDNDPLLGFFGLAAGFGSEELVERAYLDLVRTYRPGDRVFIFGFSRGAAIARLLARAIDARGAPRTVWTIKLFGKHRNLWNSKVKRTVPIAVLGCWDTVGSFGIAKTIGGVNLQQLNLFRDLSVPDSVHRAYHMVALDERRQEFEPTLMDPDPNRPERIIEVWFPGDHANIGGGWATDRLSDVALDFLLRRISSGYADTQEQSGKEVWGLHLVAWKADKLEHWKRQDSNPCIVDPDALGLIQQNFSHAFNYRPRKVPPHAMIHDTVFDRMVSSLPLYAPQSLFDLNDELDRRRDLIEAQVAKLTESNLLSADDLQKIEGYKMKLRLNRFADYYARTLAPSFSSEYVANEHVLALAPDGSLDTDGPRPKTAQASR